jgi:hypothetical protein
MLYTDSWELVVPFALICIKCYYGFCIICYLAIWIMFCSDNCIIELTNPQWLYFWDQSEQNAYRDIDSNCCSWTWTLDVSNQETELMRMLLSKKGQLRTTIFSCGLMDASVIDWNRFPPFIADSWQHCWQHQYLELSMSPVKSYSTHGDANCPCKPRATSQVVKGEAGTTMNLLL